MRMGTSEGGGRLHREYIAEPRLRGRDGIDCTKYALYAPVNFAQDDRMAHDPVIKRNRRRAMLGITGAAFAAGAAGVIAGGGPASAARDDPAIVGAWLVRWRGATRQHLRTWA